MLNEKTHQLSERRIQFGVGLINLGNIAAGAFVFGQFMNNQNINLNLCLIGLLVMAFAYVLAIITMTEKRKHA